MSSGIRPGAFRLRSALSASRIGDGSLTFEAAGDDGFRDRETGSLWSLWADALEEALKGESPDPIPHGNHLWFAWDVFKPENRIMRIHFPGNSRGGTC